MLRRLAFAFAATPTAALAEGTMPQMDFKNPLTADQIFWMVVILVALYLALSRWALPRIGEVLENRAALIERDLNAAQAAKAAADQTVARLNATMKAARANAQGEITSAVAAAKTRAAEQAAVVSARLEAQLAESEKQIETARVSALAAIRPVAIETTSVILARLTGLAPAEGEVAPQVAAVMASRAA